MEPICIVPAGDVCGEAATWDAAAHRIYWTDINRFLLHSHDPDSGATRTHMFDQPVVALSLTDKRGVCWSLLDHSCSCSIRKPARAKIWLPT